MPEVVPSLVLDEVFTLLVDRIVGQVHAQVVQVAAFGRHVVLRGEPRQALLVNEDSKRHYRSDKHVYAQVKLEIVHEKRLVEVALGHVVLA